MGTNSPRSGAAASGAFWAAVIVLAVGATRIGSLERETPGSDEATFILMAASVLDGDLPFVALMDFKPPLLFFMLAGWMAAFGESLLVARLFGDACLLLSCIAVFAIARRWTDPVSTGLGAAMTVGIATGVAPYTTAEAPATALLMAALWLLIARGGEIRAAAAAGLLLSLMVLTRTNLCVVAAAVGVWLAAVHWSGGRRACAAFLLAALAPLGVLIPVYWLAGALPELQVALVDIHLAFAGGSIDAAAALGAHLDRWFGAILSKPHFFGVFTLAAVVGVGAGRKSRNAEWSGREILLLVVLGAVMLSILVSDHAAYPHYWLQFFPIWGVFAARAIGWARAKKGWRWAAYAFVFACLAEAAKDTVPSTVRVVSEGSRTFDRHFVRRSALAIARDRKPGDTVWAPTHHLVYWYLDAAPPLRLVHPGDIAKPERWRPLVAAGYLPEDPMKTLLAAHPAYFVTDSAEPVPSYFGEADAARLRRAIMGDYAVFHDEGGVRVYRRKRGEAGASTPPPPRRARADRT